MRKVPRSSVTQGPGESHRRPFSIERLAACAYRANRKPGSRLRSKHPPVSISCSRSSDASATVSIGDAPAASCGAAQEGVPVSASCRCCTDALTPSPTPGTMVMKHREPTERFPALDRAELVLVV